MDFYILSIKKLNFLLHGTNVFNKIVLFFVLSLIACICDVGIFFSYHMQFLYCVLYFYIFQLLIARNYYKLFFLGALISIESFMFYGTLAAPLITLIPLTIAEIQLRHNFYQSWGYFWGVSSLFMAAQILVVEPFFIDLNLGTSYTFFKLCVSISIVGLLSLKNYYQDKRDNRGVNF